MANIPDDLERRIAESLRNRADDVTPSPELWTRVESTVNRQSRRTWGLAIAGTALVAAAAAVVIPQILDDEGVIVAPGPSETPTVEPTGAPTATEEPTNNTDDPTQVPGSPANQAILATDGEDLFLVGLDGTRIGTLYQGNRQDERSLVSFSVRPGSTANDIDAIVLFGGEGGSRFFRLRIEDRADGGDGSFTELPDQYQPNARFLEVPTRPAFSPDGRHVAWVEMPEDEQADGPTLRTIGWTDDGPGTGNTSDDNASFTLTDLPVQPYRVEDWVWERDATETPGHLVLRAAGQSTIETVLAPIGRQSDGGLFLPTDGTTLVDGAVVDRAEVGSPGEVFTVHQLVVANDGSQDAEGLTWIIEHQYEDGSDSTGIDLGPTADPGMGWIDATGDLVLAGHGSTMVLVEDGNVTSLTASDGAALVFGALLPTG